MPGTSKAAAKAKSRLGAPFKVGFPRKVLGPLQRAPLQGDIWDRRYKGLPVHYFEAHGTYTSNWAYDPT